MDSTILEKLEQRLGRLHARQRLGIESDYEARIFGGRARNFFHIENWYSIHSVIRNTLRLAGLHGRGVRNTLDIQVRRHAVMLPTLPPGFNDFTILHLSDLHVDMNPQALQALIDKVRTLEYDICVLTGDYRAKTFGDFSATLAGMARLRAQLRDPVYAVLGNHDTIQMVPGLEDMDIRVLLNESITLERTQGRLHLVGIDDAHYYRVDNIEKAVQGIPHDEVSILLSHTPEIYQQAAHADFDLLLCGHTHGGQICLPGGYPITLDASCPRAIGAGAWRHHNMIGYTSVGAGSSIVGVRLNCPPEVTLHTLHCG